MKTSKTWELSVPTYRDIHGGGFIEAVCPHGVGHHNGIHGCHMSKTNPGKYCCDDCPSELWEQVSKDE